MSYSRLSKTGIVALAGFMAASLPLHARQTRGDDAVTSPRSSGCAKVVVANQRKDAATIQKIEQGWLTAEYHGHRDFLECLLEPDYRTSGKSGKVRSRAEVIGRVPLTADDAKPVPPLETIVVIHGNAASAHSIMHSKDAAGNPKDVHFVDAYTFHDGRWFAFSGADI